MSCDLANEKRISACERVRELGEDCIVGTLRPIGQRPEKSHGVARVERPQPERFHVPQSTADLVNATRAAGRRVIAVGTTVTRALESAVTDDGSATAASGWTDVVLGPEHPPRLVTGLVTGWHDPAASHLHLVESVAGPELTQQAYDAAVGGGYLWHEFGDSSLLIP